MFVVPVLLSPVLLCGVRSVMLQRRLIGRYHGNKATAI